MWQTIYQGGEKWRPTFKDKLPKRKLCRCKNSSPQKVLSTAIWVNHKLTVFDIISIDHICTFLHNVFHNCYICLFKISIYFIFTSKCILFVSSFQEFHLLERFNLPWKCGPNLIDFISVLYLYLYFFVSYKYIICIIFVLYLFPISKNLISKKGFVYRRNVGQT